MRTVWIAVGVICLAVGIGAFAAPKNPDGVRPSTIKVDGVITVEKSERERELDTASSDRAVAISKSLLSWNAALVVVTVALVAVTGILAAYTYRLWRDAKRSSELTIRTMQDTARKELRAYIALDTIEHVAYEDFHGIPRNDNKLTIRIKNYGKTPAYHVSVIYTCFEREQPDDYRHPPTKEDDDYANVLLHPGQTFNKMAFSSENGICIDRVLDVGLHLREPFYIYGRIDYQDIYKKYWQTYFCQRYDPSMPEGSRCTPHYRHNFEFPIEKEPEAL